MVQIVISDCRNSNFDLYIFFMATFSTVFYHYFEIYIFVCVYIHIRTFKVVQLFKSV